jgi:hypothetical protein
VSWVKKDSVTCLAPSALSSFSHVSSKGTVHLPGSKVHPGRPLGSILRV